ncbi:MAG: hypothetical protein DRI48_05830 [Chloroflexi bacterium]|nr:MAG: hypothetical protein DRI48_05830 [Chloroflexota bacterium]
MDELIEDPFQEEDLQQVLYQYPPQASDSSFSPIALESRLAQEMQEIAHVVREVPSQDPLTGLLKRVINRRPHIAALALVSSGGRMWASALPGGVEPESVAAMAAPTMLLGRRVALEQLGGDVRQVYVEGEGGYVILRSIGEAVILLAIAPANASPGLFLHDVDLLEKRVAQLLGIPAREPGQLTEAAASIEALRQAVGEGQTPEALEAHLDTLRDKLESLDLGFFPQRVADLRARMQNPCSGEEIAALETALLALERDVMAALEQDVEDLAVSAEAVVLELDAAAGAKSETAIETEPIDQKSSFLRRALKWLALMIASED